MPVQGQALHECKAEPEDNATDYYEAGDVPLPSPGPFPSPATPSLRENSPTKTPTPPEPPSSIEATQVDGPEAAEVDWPEAAEVEPQGSHGKEDDEDDDDDEEQYAVASKPPPPLSKDAVYHKMRRIMLPRADGTYLLSQDFRDQYKDRARGRPKLEAMFEKAGYNPEPWWELSKQPLDPF